MRLPFTSLLLWLATWQLAAAPVERLWQNGLINADNGFEYHATVTLVDAQDNVFVGGYVQAGRFLGEQVAFVAKFDREGIQRWEYWSPPQSPGFHFIMTEGMASDGSGGVLVALRRPPNAVQLVRLSTEGRASFWLNDPYALHGDLVPSVNVAAFGTNFFCVTGLLQRTNDLGYDLTCTGYAADGQRLWRTNLFGGWLHDAGLSRCVVTTAEAVFVCGVGDDGLARLARITHTGQVEWVRTSSGSPSWSQVAANDQGQVCVAGPGNYSVFSPDGVLAASHTSWSNCRIAGGLGNADFFISDRWAGGLVRISDDGQIRQRGQLPFPHGNISKSDVITLDTNTWLLSLMCPVNNSPWKSSLNFWACDRNGILKWHQQLSGYEFTDSAAGNQWLLRASDGTVRLVVNLNSSSANPHKGVVVAAFRASTQASGPVLTETVPATRTNTDNGVGLSVQAAGSGVLRYQWYRLGEMLYGETNSTYWVPAGDAGTYCVSIADDEGEIVSPAMRVRNVRTRLEIGRSPVRGAALTTVTDFGVQLLFQSSSNAVQWVTHPQIYSQPFHVPVTAIPSNALGSSAQFFRVVEVPEL